MIGSVLSEDSLAALDHTRDVEEQEGGLFQDPDREDWRPVSALVREW